MAVVEYECSNGHYVSALTTLASCPACLRGGKPCDGVLRRIGKGSRPRSKQEVPAR